MVLRGGRLLASQEQGWDPLGGRFLMSETPLYLTYKRAKSAPARAVSLMWND